IDAKEPRSTFKCWKERTPKESIAAGRARTVAEAEGRKQGCPEGYKLWSAESDFVRAGEVVEVFLQPSDGTSMYSLTVNDKPLGELSPVRTGPPVKGTLSKEPPPIVLFAGVWTVSTVVSLQ